MVREQILQKLESELKHPPESEKDVVYLLSKIKKILEIENSSKYEILKFYYNFSLHTKINNVPEDIVKKLIGTVEDDDLSADYSSVFHGPLHEQLKSFIKTKSLPNFYESDFKISKLNKLLHEVYSDTPIYIQDTSGKQYKFEFSADGTVSYSPA